MRLPSVAWHWSSAAIPPGSALYNDHSYLITFSKSGYVCTFVRSLRHHKPELDSYARTYDACRYSRSLVRVSKGACTLGGLFSGQVVMESQHLQLVVGVYV